MNAFALILGFMPGFVWLSFYLEEDPRPEPKRLIAFSFIMGGAATILALFLQTFLKNSLNLTEINQGTPLFPILVLALIEEIVKFGAAYFAVHKARDFDEPVDAMIYAVVASLGFATVENLAVVYGQLTANSLLGGIIGVTSARFVGATMLHTLTAAFMGYYWALSKKHGESGTLLATGLFIATVMHAGFNYLILNYDNMVYSLILLIIGGFFVLEDFEELKPAQEGLSPSPNDK